MAKKKKKKGSKKIYLLAFIVSLALTLLIVGTIGTLYIKHKEAKYKKEYEDAINKENENGALNDEDSTNGASDKKKNVHKPDLNTMEGLIEASKRVNILLIGTDGGRADTIILASYEPDKHKLDMITVPRDTYHEVPGYDRLDQKKINAVYGMGEQNGGGKGLKAEVGQVLGVPIHFFVIADYNAIAAIVNTVGGVGVNIEFPMHYDDAACYPPLHVHFDPGYYVLDGQQAIEYLRWRKNNGEYGAGDIPRTARQMNFLKTMINKVITSFKYEDVIKSCYEYVSTDMPMSEIIYYATTLFGFSVEDDIETHMLPGDVVFDGLSYYKQDVEATKDMMFKIYQKGLVEIKSDDENREDEFEDSFNRKFRHYDSFDIHSFSPSESF